MNVNTAIDIAITPALQAAEVSLTRFEGSVEPLTFANCEQGHRYLVDTRHLGTLYDYDGSRLSNYYQVIIVDKMHNATLECLSSNTLPNKSSKA